MSRFKLLPLQLRFVPQLAFKAAAFGFLFVLLTGFGPLWGQAINYTSASYCSPYTTYTVGEQTTAYNLLTSSTIQLGACGVNMNMFDQTHYAAIEPSDWENGAGCGACAVLNYQSHATTVMIVDRCATCGNGTHHLDLSAVAYGELVGSPGCAVNGGGGSVNTGGCPAAPGGGQVTWHFIQCPLSGSANISFNNASGNITYEFKDSSSSGWHPIVFWDFLFPIQSVSIGTSSGGPFTALTRDTADTLPEFWGGTGQSNPSAPLYYVITDDRGSSVTLGPINSISPVMQANNASFVPYGTSSVQFPGCVVGPTSTPTPTAIPGTPTSTPTKTPSATPTATIGGCLATYYDGETAATNLVSGSSWTGNATVAENAAAAHTGSNGMNISYNWPASSYYAEVGWNWAKYSNVSPRIVNLNNYTYLQLDINVAAGAPLTLGVILADWGGGGSGGVTASAPYTIIQSSSGWQTYDIPVGAFATGGASWSVTDVGEIDLEVFAPATAGTATVYLDNFGFRGTCPTSTPTPTASTTATPTSSPTLTATLSASPTVTRTATLTPTATITNTHTNTPTSTFTGTPTMSPTATSTNTPGNTATQTATSTPSGTATMTLTATFTSTLGNTATKTATATPSGTTTATPTATSTNTLGNTATSTTTSTPSGTATATLTATSTNTLGPTSTPTSTATLTASGTPTGTFTNSPTSTATGTPQNTATPTLTGTPTSTQTNSPTSTVTLTPSLTATATWTGTATASTTATPTSSPTLTATASPSPTPTGTATTTATATPSSTVTNSPTSTATGTATATLTNTRTSTPTGTPTVTPTSTATQTPTSTATVTLTTTFSPTSTPTATITLTPTITATNTITATPTATLPSYDVFKVDKNLYQPTAGVVNILVEYAIFPGDYSLSIYNSAGEHIKTLDSRTLSGPISQTYQWDGKNKYGDPCASGVYIFNLIEPFKNKTKRILLVR